MGRNGLLGLVFTRLFVSRRSKSESFGQSRVLRVDFRDEMGYFSKTRQRDGVYKFNLQPHDLGDDQSRMFEYESGVGFRVPGFFDYSYDDFIVGWLYDLKVLHRSSDLPRTGIL